MTFASLASRDSPLPTPRAATVSKGPGRLWLGMRQAVQVLGVSSEEGPFQALCAAPLSSSKWQHRPGLGGGFESVPARVGGPNCQVSGKAQRPYESAKLCTRTGPVTSG